MTHVGEAADVDVHVERRVATRRREGQSLRSPVCLYTMEEK